MSAVKLLVNYLTMNEVDFETFHHKKAYTAQEVAQSMHIPGKDVAKTIIVKIGGEYAMVVLPASYKVAFNQLRSSLENIEAKLASEDEFTLMFPDCELGAMPPFGNLYEIPVYMAESLNDDEEIFFNAGTHTDVVKMKLKDYKRLVKPIIIKLSEHEYH